MNMAQAIAAVFRRDIALAWAAGGGAAAPLGFFAGGVAMVPLAVGPDRATLQLIGPPLLWVMAALAALLVLERLFQADLEDGSLDQLLLSSAPLELLVAVKGLALWLAIGGPLTLAAAPLAITLQAPLTATPAIIASMAIGFAGFVFLGLTGAAVAAGVRRGGVLIALLVLPFFAPVIIFGAAAAQAAVAGTNFWPPLALLSGISLAGLALGPIGAAAALRLQAS
jgi:heme exporter protein B